ncbi:hypothetical protein, partial [Bacillus altitudinis]|uniref:hypothetical protein n=1 Tax=Bacillus altitudinis TaxID=293387 RepID=UPI001C92F99D
MALGFGEMILAGLCGGMIGSKMAVLESFGGLGMGSGIGGSVMSGRCRKRGRVVKMIVGSVSGKSGLACARFFTMGWGIDKAGGE